MKKQDYYEAEIPFDSLYLWYGCEDFGTEHVRLMYVDKTKNISYYLTNQGFVEVPAEKLKKGSNFLFRYVLIVNHVEDEIFYNKSGNTEKDIEEFRNIYTEMKLLLGETNASVRVEDILKLQNFYDNNYEFKKNETYEKNCNVLKTIKENSEKSF